jgi:hypothetical protein
MSRFAFPFLNRFKGKALSTRAVLRAGQKSAIEQRKFRDRTFFLNELLHTSGDRTANGGK